MAEQNVDSIIKTVDSLLEESAFAEITKILKEALKVHPENVDLLWRLSRSLYQEAGESTDRTEQESLYTEALESSKKVIQIADHWAGYKWSGIITAALNDFKSSKDKIAAAYDIKEFFTNADKRLTNDPTIKFALGKWCYSIASIGWIERNAAAILFATPPQSSYEEALTYFLQAETIITAEPEIYKTSFCQTYAMIGKTYQAMNKKDEAAAYHQKCIDAKAYTTSDKKYAEEAKAALNTKSGWW